MMISNHRWLRPGRLFLIALTGCVVLNVSMAIVGSRLTTPEARLGIISFEFAGDVDTARRIVGSWDASARLSAAFNLGLDYLFMPFYALVFCLACRWAGRQMAQVGWQPGGWASWLAGGQWLAAGMDALENLALWQVLRAVVHSGTLEAITQPWPRLAAWMAVGKFGLLLAGLAYAGLGVIARRVGRSGRSSSL